MWFRTSCSRITAALRLTCLKKKKKKKKKAFFPNAVNCLAAGFHSEEITIRGTCQLHDSRIVCCSLLEHGSSETSAVNLVPIGPNN